MAFSVGQLEAPVELPVRTFPAESAEAVRRASYEAVPMYVP